MTAHLYGRSHIHVPYNTCVRYPPIFQILGSMVYRKITIAKMSLFEDTFSIANVVFQ